MNVERPGYGALGSRDIAQLIAVADHGSIRRAADALGMTQPGLSKNIRLIEERLGMLVFDRSTSGAMPTDIGVLLLRRGRQILLDLAAIHRDLRDELLSETGRVRIGVGPIPAPVIAALVIPACQRDHPGIAIEIDIGTPSAQYPRVERGEIDMFIGNCDTVSVSKSTNVHLINEVAPVFLARAGHPLAAQRAIPLAALAPFKVAHIRSIQQFDDWYRHSVGVAIDVAYQCDSYDMLADAVEASDMVAPATPQVLAQIARRHTIIALDIAGIDYRHRIHCAQPAGRPMSRPAQKVLQLIEAAFVTNISLNAR